MANEMYQLVSVRLIFYNPLIFMTKLSILIQYLKIFAPTRDGKTYRAIHFLIWTNLLFYLATLTVHILVYVQRLHTQNPVAPRQSIDDTAVQISSAVINLVSDFSMLILPLAKLLKLQLPRNRKIGVIAIFALGFLYVIIMC